MAGKGCGLSGGRGKNTGGNGGCICPRAAWLPDSFGHSATAPDVLAAAGFTSVAFSRVDGWPTIFQWIQDPHAPVVPGSGADRLSQLHSADFVWRGPGGGNDPPLGG